MLRRKAAPRHTLLTALALLLCAMGGWAGAEWSLSSRQSISSSSTLTMCDGLRSGHHAARSARGADEEKATSSRPFSRESARLSDGPSSSSAKTAGSGGGGSAPPGNKEFAAALPSNAVFRTAHSQAALKQRLHALLTRAKPQQRLALYPKHGFW